MNQKKCCQLKNYQRDRNRSRSKEKKKSQVIDLENTHYVLEKGDLIGDDYQYDCKIQDGTFGRVVRAKHIISNQYRAVKILKEAHNNDAVIEYKLIKKLNTYPRLLNHPGRDNIMKVYDIFQHKSNACISFEELGKSLFEVLYQQDFRPFPMKWIQIILKDVLNGLDYMHKVSMIHTDIKPENILLCNSHTYNVKLVDFGNTVAVAEPCLGLINTRQYRAPEVIIGAKWSWSSDIWSLGCVAMELYTGNYLFNVRKDDLQHLEMIEKVCGPFPEWMVAQSQYHHNNQLMMHLKTKSEQTQIDNLRPIQTQYSTFTDLINKMIVINPNQRMRTYELLEHPYFQQRFD